MTSNELLNLKPGDVFAVAELATGREITWRATVVNVFSVKEVPHYGGHEMYLRYRNPGGGGCHVHTIYSDEFYLSPAWGCSRTSRTEAEVLFPLTDAEIEAQIDALCAANPYM